MSIFTRAHTHTHNVIGCLIEKKKSITSSKRKNKYLCVLIANEKATNPVQHIVDLNQTNAVFSVDSQCNGLDNLKRNMSSISHKSHEEDKNVLEKELLLQRIMSLQ